jgi:transposase
MSKTYRPWNPNQQWLLPPSVHDCLPQDDLVYFILDTVNELDLCAITAKYEQQERGYPPYNPRMMVALLFYAYCRGIFSSRKIMQACEERLTFRVIVSDDIPNWRTISDFRKLHLKVLEQLFVQVLQLCQKAGLVKLGHIALDGTKVKANASCHKAMSHGRMKQEEERLKQEIHQLLGKAEAVDLATSEPRTKLTVNGQSVKGMKLSKPFDMSKLLLSKKKGNDFAKSSIAFVAILSSTAWYFIKSTVPAATSRIWLCLSVWRRKKTRKYSLPVRNFHRMLLAT